MKSLVRSATWLPPHDSLIHFRPCLDSSPAQKEVNPNFRISALIPKLVSLLFLLVLLLGISFSLEQQARAYVDPGSGLVLFQSLSAIFTGGLFYFRRRLKLWFTREREKDADAKRS